MEREYRYLVIKLKDAKAALTVTERSILGIIADKISDHREQQGKAPLEGVVVESDWPEYEPTWKAIERRVDGLAPQEGER